MNWDYKCEMWFWVRSTHKSSFPPTEPTSGCVVLTLFALPVETVSGALILFRILHCFIQPWGTLSIKTTVMDHRNWNVELTEQNWLWNFNFFQNYFLLFDNVIYGWKEFWLNAFPFQQALILLVSSLPLFSFNLICSTFKRTKTKTCRIPLPLPVCVGSPTWVWVTFQG